MITIKANYPLWLIALSAVILLGFSFWSYRNTLPPTSTWLKGLLTFLRWSALFGGIIVLSQPIIERTTTDSSPATVALLIDRSASMGLTQGGIDRVAEVKQLLKSDYFVSLKKRYSVEMFSFADSLNWWEQTQADSIPGQIGSDIAGSFVQASEELLPIEPSAVIIVSDGAHNSGPDPVRVARTAHAPIWCIGVGSPEQSRDLMILNILANPVVYQGSRTPVDITLRAINSDEQSVQVTIREPSGKVVGRKQLLINSDFDEQTVSMEIEVTNAGRQRYSVELSQLESELTLSNNRRSFYLNVLAGKMKLLLMAGVPDNGLGDLVRRLNSDEHIELIQRTTRPDGFYEGSWLDEKSLKEIDAVILHKFPVRSTDRNRLKQLAETVARDNLPLWFIDGGQVDTRLLNYFEDRLPVTTSKDRAMLGTGQVVPIKRHAIIADPDEIDYAGKWSQLPPLTYLLNRYNPKVQSTVLAQFQTKGLERRYPAIVVSEQGANKSIAILGRDLWLWGLSSPSSEASIDESVLEPLLERTIRWLAVRKSDKRVNIKFDKDLYSTQEQVGFTVTAMDEAYRPVDGAEVTTEVLFDGEVVGSASIEGVGQGRYRGSFQPWQEGEYTVKVLASSNGDLIGNDQGKISVEPFNIELLDARLNEELLIGIGESSGGGYVSIDRTDSLFSSFNFPPQEQHQTDRWELWGRGWLLVVIIGLLSIEWFIRVRVGML